MVTVRQVHDFLEAFAPTRLAESWDNVGLLVGDPEGTVARVMTCLTVTPDSAHEAIDERAELIVSHHPLPFRPLKRLTTETVAGRLVWELARSAIAVHSPHTGFDSAAEGINQQLARGLELDALEPLVPAENDPDSLGAGRQGVLAETLPLRDVAARLARFLGIDGLQMVGADSHTVSRVAVACGSAGSFLPAARQADCQLLVTGETTFHTCLEAEASDVALLLPGHYASERFAVERLAEVLADEFPQLEVWPSRRERDPLRWVAAGK